MRRIAIGVLVLLAACSSGRSTSDRKADAYKACQAYINHELKAPATAVYPRIDAKEVIVSLKADTAYIAGYVDAQNGFGALIRSTIQCSLTSNNGKDWTKKFANVLES